MRPWRGRNQRTLVTGGARSGKSVWAERALRGEPTVTYLATAAGYPDDADWQARVAAHRSRRPASWRTVETAEVAAVLAGSAGAVLIDDIGNWLTRTLDDAGAWEDPDAVRLVRTRTDELVTAWRQTRSRVVAVTNEVGSGVVPATPAGRLFRDELGRLNARLAAHSHRVMLLTCGIPQRLR